MLTAGASFTWWGWGWGMYRLTLKFGKGQKRSCDSVPIRRIWSGGNQRRGSGSITSEPLTLALDISSLSFSSIKPSTYFALSTTLKHFL